MKKSTFISALLVTSFTFSGFAQTANDLDTAVRLGDHQKVKALMDAGIDATASHLRTAAQNGTPEVVKVILTDADIKVNAKDGRGNTALMYAANVIYTQRDADRRKAEGLRFVETVKVLLANGADAKNALDNGSNHPEIIKLLIAAGADVKSRGAWMSLMDAINTLDENGLERIKILVEAGVNINWQEKGMTGFLYGEGGVTAIMAATAKGNTVIIKLLLDAGADTNLENDRGETALVLATDKGQLKIAKTLLAAGADVNGGNPPALIKAITRNNSEIVEILIEAGADVNALDEMENSALKLANEIGDKEIIALLVAAGAKDNTGEKKEDDLLL